MSWRVFFCAMATLLFTYLVAESKDLRESKFVNVSYIQVCLISGCTLMGSACHNLTEDSKKLLSEADVCLRL